MKAEFWNNNSCYIYDRQNIFPQTWKHAEWYCFTKISASWNFYQWLYNESVSEK